MQSGELTAEALSLAQGLKQTPPQHSRGREKFHVDGVGGRLYFAYEQLRNAAEYSDRHLLLRRAIERFLQRTANLNHPHPLAQELIIELTQARYLNNDSVPLTILDEIDATLTQFASLYRRVLVHQRHRTVARQWILQTASVHVEQMLVPQQHTRVFADFAYHHYLDRVDLDDLPWRKKTDHYKVAIYCATHRAILKSDIATIRAYALASQILSGGDGDDAAYFATVCRLVDELNQHRSTNRLERLISQHGAPMRVLRELVIAKQLKSSELNNRSKMLDRVRSTTTEQYLQVRQRLNEGIVRSVAFVAITKILIGVVLEVPYDLVRHGEIIWKPLIINVLFPPTYMAVLGLSIRPPSQKNIGLVEEAVERIVFTTSQPVAYRWRRRITSPAMNNLFNLLYGVTFVVSMAALVWLLILLDFNLVSGIIFFIFLSTASFLGFRLTQIAREFEMVEARRSAIGTIADFFFTPFMRIGYWLSDTYSRLNVVTRVLDLFIEMPLKFSLSFFRQWIGFLRDKQEEI